MYEQEKQRANHFLILLCGTIFTIVLTGEVIVLGWELGAVLLLLLGLGMSWGIYVSEKLPISIQIWLYFIQMMLALFFYGSHETSRYDLAPLMILVIIMYSATEMNRIISLCVVTYYLTMGYGLMFVAGGFMEVTAPSVARILLHFVLVYAAGYLAKLVIKKRSKERKNTENRIAQLEEINSRVEDFLANVSHELRTPINVVTGIAAMMLKNEEDAGKRKDILSIQHAGHRLLSQIEDILDYTEIDAGRLQVSEETYTISSLVNDIIIGERLVEKANGLELIFDIDANQPSVLLGDGRLIKKILKHLIDNAVKFTKKGAVYVRIYALRKEYGINLCIRVSDTGIGIDEENLGKITETFFQFNGGRNRSAGGLGLGLSIVYGLAAAMEGFIWVESTVGSGTTVSVSIPQKIEDDSPLMTVADRSGLCLACYLRLEQYERPEVRNYYNEMITHAACGLGIPLHRAFDLNELKRLVSTYQLTHLFIGKGEYEEGKAYFESLDETIEVILVADDGFTLPSGSRVKLFRKPFYGLSITNILNSKTAENADGSVKVRMLCPGVRVLVVDDQPINLMVAEAIFKNYQMVVSTAGSGMEALDLCEKNDYDLVFLDHMMPEMDGVETLKRIRQIQINTERVFTVIAFTANAVSGAREMFFQAGFDEFVSKPIEILELERVLRKVLPKSSVVFLKEKN